MTEEYKCRQVRAKQHFILVYLYKLFSLRALIKISPLIIFAMIINCGCKKSKDISTEIPPGISAEIDNVKWKTIACYAQSAYGYAPMGVTPHYELWIDAIDNVGGNMKIEIHNWDKRTGTYLYNDKTDIELIIWYRPDTSFVLGTYYQTYAGAVTITKLSSTNIQGSFCALMYDLYRRDSLVINNGEFNLPFEKR